MELNLSNKIAIVTGSSAGIGFAIAKTLYQAQATVILTGRSKEKLQEAYRLIINNQKDEDRLHILTADLAQTSGIDLLIHHFPTCDILINNLGIYFPKNFEDITDEDWNKTWETNVMSGVRLSRHYLPAMRNNNWGRIIFISSESGLQVPIEMIHYGVSKTAQIAIARGIAEITAGTGITSNSILVGPTKSEGVENFVEDLAKHQHLSAQQVEKDFFEKTRPTSLLKRFITPDEIAAFVAYLCSEPAIAINGAALRVDGGVLRSIV